MPVKDKLKLLKNILYEISEWKDEQDKKECNKHIKNIDELCQQYYKDNLEFYEHIKNTCSTDYEFVCEIEHFTFDMLEINIVNLPNKI